MQGQYTLPLAYQGVSRYAWQTVTNVIALITGAIAAGLYGNIGLKVIYINIVEGLLKGPPLMTSRGRVVWSGMVVLFWGLAFVIASAIPSVGTLSGLVAAVCVTVRHLNARRLLLNALADSSICALVRVRGYSVSFPLHSDALRSATCADTNDWACNVLLAASRLQCASLDLLARFF